VRLAEFLIALFDLRIEDNEPPKLSFYEDIMRSMLGKNPGQTCTFHEIALAG
jgi:hypothetical protein